MPLFNSVTGRQLIVDEMDEPVLHLGSGNQALSLRENFMGPRGPVINVDIARQPALEATGRAINAQAPHAVFPEFPPMQQPVRPGEMTVVNPNHRPFYMQGDATDLAVLQQLSPTRRFREIHAVNPYGFHPHTTLPLLNPSGTMRITGQNTNQYAQPTPSLPASTRIAPVYAAPDPNINYRSTRQGEMHSEHAALNHTLTGGRPLDTSRSSTHTLRKKGG